jgi:hypothetical protein
MPITIHQGRHIIARVAFLSCTAATVVLLTIHRPSLLITGVTVPLGVIWFFINLIHERTKQQWTAVLSVVYIMACYYAGNWFIVPKQPSVPSYLPPFQFGILIMTWGLACHLTWRYFTTRSLS